MADGAAPNQGVVAGRIMLDVVHRKRVESTCVTLPGRPHESALNTAFENLLNHARASR